MKFFAFCLLLLAATASALYSAEDKVVVLTDASFDEAIQNAPLSLIEFYAPWCGHCKSLAPNFKTAAIELDGVAMLGAVDCTTEKAVCEKFGIKGFPTLKIFRDTGSHSEYNAGRTSADIIKFIKKQTSPAAAPLTLAELEDFKAKDTVTIVGYFADAGSADAQAFAATANTLRDEFAFGIVTEGVTASSLSLFSADGEIKFEGEFTTDRIKDFVVAEAFPLFGDIGPENYHKYANRGLPIVWFFLDLEAEVTAEIKTHVSAVAPEFKGKLSLVKLDGVKWSTHAKNYGCTGETPCIVIEEKETKKNFVYPQKDTVTLEGLRAHLVGFVEKSLAPTVKSEAEPAENNGPVTVLVGTTFEKVALDKTKDVFVEFYAPWCGHCKQLAPKWDKLGEIFASEDSVVIAKMDMTGNDAPGVPVKGFPTLLFFRADDKTPEKYNGERTAEAMATWIRANASTLKGQAVEHEHDEL